MDEVTLIPCYSLKPNTLTLFERQERKFMSRKQIEGYKNLNDNQNYIGDLSENAYKRLRKTIDFMLYLSPDRNIRGRENKNKYQNFETLYVKGEMYKDPVKYKLTFITLTLPAKQIHTDEEIKSKLLHQMLIELKKDKKVDLYIWKAEKQENGNIHFHILNNRYIDHKWLRSTWNRICEKLGYVSRYQSNMKVFFKDGFRLSNSPLDKRTQAQQFKAYQKGLENNFMNPNSTDIHGLYKVKNTAAYLAKYISKDIREDQSKQSLKSLKKEIDALNEELYKKELEIFVTSPGSFENIKITKDIENIKNAIQSHNHHMKKLKESGISGRIWGCSSLLSKMKSYIEEERWQDIPDLQIVEEISRYKTVKDIGDRQVHTFIFDMDKTPHLKEKFRKHINSIIAVQSPPDNKKLELYEQLNT